jgi:hypothetical protein
MGPYKYRTDLSQKWIAQWWIARSIAQPETCTKIDTDCTNTLVCYSCGENK